MSEDHPQIHSSRHILKKNSWSLEIGHLTLYFVFNFLRLIILQEVEAKLDFTLISFPNHITASWIYFSYEQFSCLVSLPYLHSEH